MEITNSHSNDQNKASVFVYRMETVEEKLQLQRLACSLCHVLAQCEEIIVSAKKIDTDIGQTHIALKTNFVKNCQSFGGGYTFYYLWIPNTQHEANVVFTLLNSVEQYLYKIVQYFSVNASLNQKYWKYRDVLRSNSMIFLSLKQIQNL